MNTPNIDIEHVKRLIHKKIKYHYMDQYISQPVIDEDKLHLLISILNHSSLTEQKKIQYAVTTMLVQLALDTHDLVSNNDISDEIQEETLKRQLHVLAGDFYSGLYYYLLSEVGEIEFIQLLASAIKEINENKMKMYYENIHSFHEYIDTVHNIGGLLIFRVAAYLHNPAMEKIAAEWITLKQLLKEKQKMTKNQSTLLSSWINNHSIGKLDTIILAISQKIESMLSELPTSYDNLKNYLLLNMSNELDYKTSVTEEG